MLNLSLSEDIRITWASWDTCYMEMHMGTKGRREQSTGEVYPPFTITLIMRKSISPLAMRRPSHVYGPSSVFFMPRIWRWLLLSSLNRTKEARGQMLRKICSTQDENLSTINEQLFKMYFCTFGDENMCGLQTPLVYGTQKWQHDTNNDKSFPFCHHVSKRICNISAAPKRNMEAVSKSSLGFRREGNDFNHEVI